MITAYARMVLDIPFTITLPQMNNAICPDSNLSCNTDNYLQASFSIEPMDLSIYVGIEFQLKILENVINIMRKIIPTNNNDDITLTWNVAEFILLDRASILSEKQLGCIPLNGLLLPLNTYYKSTCHCNNPF